MEAALRECEQLQQEREATAAKSGREPKEARASTTDSEARVMKFSDGGFRPGYNVQFATDTASGLIVGVTVVNAGTDNRELSPMLDQLQERYGRTPAEMLVDGGFATQEAITDAAENHDCLIFAPLKDEAKQRAAGKDPHARKRGDNDAMAAWRARMGETWARTIYKLRCQTAEWVNAICRNHGLAQMPVRGTTKCGNVALLHAITHNLMRALTLRTQAKMAKHQAT